MARGRVRRAPGRLRPSDLAPCDTSTSPFDASMLRVNTQHVREPLAHTTHTNCSRHATRAPDSTKSLECERHRGIGANEPKIVVQNRRDERSRNPGNILTVNVLFRDKVSYKMDNGIRSGTGVAIGESIKSIGYLLE